MSSKRIEIIKAELERIRLKHGGRLTPEAVVLAARDKKSPLWKDTLVIVTYDENGGFWDHVAPPKIDRWGPGARVPAIIVSPFAKKGFIDSTQYDTTSILKLIAARFGLEPLGPRDAAANDLTNALDLTPAKKK